MPFLSWSAAITLLKTRMGFIAGPPYMPEWRSILGPVMVISSRTMPRSLVVMAGVFGSHMLVSQTKAASQDSSFALALRKGTSEGEPDSSSPSIRKVARMGSVPVVRIQARAASTKVMNWPLSSEVPRPYMRFTLPSVLMVGSKGGVFHRSSGSAGCTS